MKKISLPNFITITGICLVLAFYPGATILAAEEGSPASSADKTSMEATASESKPAPGLKSEPGPRTPPGPKTDPGPKVEPGPKSTPGPKVEPGPKPKPDSEKTKYIFNTQTGQWENGQLAWNPATGQATPIKESSYAFVPENSTWASDDWVYNSKTKKYEPIPQILKNLNGSKLGQDSSSLISDTSADFSGKNGAVDSGSNHFFGNYNNTTVDNYLALVALSGDADVSNNTSAGNATSGNSNVLSSVVNMIQTVWQLTGGRFFSFLGNIFGDVSGDIVLDPTTMSLTHPASSIGELSGSIENTGPSSNDKKSHDNLEINNSSNNQINNTIDLDARSGDADIRRNTQAGDARSGDATVTLNLANIINSVIASGNSFFGVLNVFGDFVGDVLFPSGFLDGLIKGKDVEATNSATANVSTTGLDSQNNISDNQYNAGQVTNDTSSNIANNIDSLARSGQANVRRNTDAGSAISGQADINLTILNLLGQNVYGENAILIFVNVLGRWIGMIMDAPSGQSTATLGKNSNFTIENTGSNSQNSISSNSLQNTSSSSSNNSSINNDIKTTAQSGDAMVEENSKAGDARSGNAQIATNILNLIGTNLSLTNWFGVLFINIFGNWTGGVGLVSANQLQNHSPVFEPAVSSRSDVDDPLVNIATNQTNNNKTWYFDDANQDSTPIAINDDNQIELARFNQSTGLSSPPQSSMASVAGNGLWAWLVVIGLCTLGFVFSLVRRWRDVRTL